MVYRIPARVVSVEKFFRVVETTSDLNRLAKSEYDIRKSTILNKNRNKNGRRQARNYP